ncbi:MAG: hypothetical protein PWQ73_468 [Petrotoga sp.]|nr:hypothetical protein [Petrotoga sp.]
MRLLFFLIGLTSSWLAFKWSIWGFKVYPYLNLIYVLSVYSVIWLLHRRSSMVKLKIDLFLILIVIFVLSSTVQFIFNYKTIWSVPPSKWLIQTITWIFPLKLLMDNIKSERLIRNFLRGFEIGVKVQIIWSLIEVIFWYAYKIPINQVIFEGILKVDVGHTFINLRNYGAGIVYRVSGFNWDPAYFGILCAFIILTDPSILWKLVSAIALIMSNSRASIFGFSMTTVLLILNYVTRRYFSNTQFKVKTRKVINVLLLFIAFGIIVIAITDFILPDYFRATTAAIKNVFEESKDVGTVRHLKYYTYSSLILTKNPLIALFGYGPRSGGKFFCEEVNKGNIPSYMSAAKPSTAWSPESSVIGILVDSGILGFLVYIMIFFRIHKFTFKAISISDDLRKKIGIFLMIVFWSSFFYSYIYVHYVILFLIAMFSLDKKNGGWY